MKIKTYVIRTFSLILLLIISLSSCQKDKIDTATCDIKTWEQSNYIEWGYHDNNNEFHHILSGFAMESIDNIIVQDTTFTSRGEFIVIKYGITYTFVGGQLYPIERKKFYDTAEIKYRIYNNSYRDIGCFDIWVEIRYYDNNTTDEVIINGTDIQSRAEVEDIFYYDSKGKRISDIVIKDYAFYKNC